MPSDRPEVRAIRPCNYYFNRESTRLSNMEVEQHLSKLPLAEGASFNSAYREHEPYCLPDTRVELLKHIQNWSEASAKPIFWLSGHAGAGKSTISRTVAKSFSEQGHLIGSFFFSRGHGDLGTAAKFVSTFARQLVSAHSALKPHISEVIEHNEGILTQGIHNQWKELVVGPLTKLTKSSSFSGNLKLIFVLDALDECDREDDINVILRLFLELQHLAAVNFQIFLTSRPEIPIRLSFSNMPEIMHENLNLGEVPREVVNRDIYVFLETELRRIATQRNLSSWPEPAAIDMLTEKCEQLFIYAATVCKFVGDPADLPRERLALILQRAADPDSHLPELDKMYAAVLEHSVEGSREGIAQKRITERFQLVIGSFIVLFDTLPALSLAYLLDMSSEEVEISFSPLHSLIYVPSNNQDALRSIHPSFSEFLLDHKRCLKRNFHIVSETAHSRLAQRCLQILSHSLCQDICHLKLPAFAIQNVTPEVVDSCIPKHVQYACQYFAYHLSRMSGQQIRQAGVCNDGALHVFLKHNFLNWLEAMSLMRRMPESVDIVTLLESLIDVCCFDLVIKDGANLLSTALERR